ncbi:sugar transferase [Flavobacterium sp.]|uniref:sugar transferase n=1 Tax=Flavobacterium sp. TaxID=239 RepID=UPI003F69CCC2
MRFKRIFDFFISFFMLLFIGWFVVLLFFLASFDTQSFGLFFQERIGQFGKTFKIFKIKTVNDTSKRISFYAKLLRKSKLDELPQLLNILLGQMSFVGPRPDVSGYADALQGEDRIILSLKPGVTGLASLKYRNEEQLLADQIHPEFYNDTVIWPDKVRINRWYVANRTFFMDVKIVFYTFIPLSFDVDGFIDG